MKDSLQAPAKNRHEVTVGAWQQTRGHLDNGDLAAQCRVHRAQLETYVSTADHQQGFGNVRELQCCRGIENPPASERRVGKRRRAGPGCQNGMVEHELLLCVTGANAQPGRLDDGRPTLDVVDEALLRELSKPIGQLPHHALPPGAQLFEVDVRICKFDTPVARLARLGEHLRHVEQSLRGYAAFVQTDAPRVRLTSYQGDTHAQVGSQKGGGVSARTCPNDGQLRRSSHRSTRESVRASL